MNKQKLIEWIDELKIEMNEDSPFNEEKKWYNQALQDVVDATNSGVFDFKEE